MEPFVRIIPLLVIALIIVALVATARAEESEEPALSDQELRALAQVHAVNGLEIKVGQLAVGRGSPPVEAYAKHLIADHEKADAELMAIVREHGATVPEYAPAGPAEQSALTLDAVQADVLASLSGSSFDRTYLTMMVEDHNRELAKLDDMLAKRGDADAMACIARARPMVARHAAEAKQLLAQIH
jgi:putative membrane protein